MRLYTNKHQWTKLYVYVSVFGPVTHHIIIKYRACHTTQYENSVIKLVMVYYLIKPRFFYIIILLCILGSILYHIYIQTLVIFIVLQSSMVPIASKNILQQLPEIYYESQIWLPKNMGNEYFRHIYTQRHKCTKLYVYASIFGQVTHHFLLKFRSKLATQYENSVIKT